MTAIADRSQRVDGYLGIIIAGKLTRIELWDGSIESPGMNGFELRGIDAPLIYCDLQSVARVHRDTHSQNPPTRIVGVAWEF